MLIVNTGGDSVRSALVPPHLVSTCDWTNRSADETENQTVDASHRYTTHAGSQNATTTDNWNTIDSTDASTDTISGTHTNPDTGTNTSTDTNTDSTENNDDRAAE